MRVPREVVDRIRESVVLSQLVGEYVRLAREGGGTRYKGLCPFHSERTPSFHVNDDRGFYYCFGCQATGDAYTFLSEHTGISFMEALELLSARTGIELPQVTDEAAAQGQQDREGKEAYYRVMTLANAFFMRSLDAPNGEEARAYLQSRGIDEETARLFQLGYAPESWDALVHDLCGQSIPAGHLVRAGLARQREGQPANDRSGIYDAFRHRVMFPVLEINGKAVAFSGRALSAEERAKYINSPETKFYTKGQHLYGIHASRRHIRERDQVVLVEGNFDVVALHAHGVNEAVAPLGTALTPRQAEILSRFSKRVVMAFDGDRAGRVASRRAFEVLLDAGIEDVRWLQFADGEDPDSYVREHGGDALRQRIESAPMMMELMIEESLAETLVNNDPTIRSQAAQAAAEWLRRIRDSFAAQAWRDEVARRLQAAPSVIAQAESVARTRAARQYREPEAAETPPIEVLALTRHEQALVLAIDSDPTRLDRIARQQLFRVMMTPRFGKALEKVAQRWSGGADTWRVLIEELDDRGAAAAMLGVLAGGALQVATDDDAFDTLLKEFQVRWVRVRSKEMEAELARFHREGDNAKVSEILEEMERLHRFIAGV